jgi:rhodanese-related sulfurtransferase
MIATISRRALRAKIERGDAFALIEALPAGHFQERHLPGAVNIPHDRIDALAPALVPDKATEIVVYCANAKCRNSRVAAERLAALGYADVKTYEDGKQDWIDAGLPVVIGPRAVEHAA